MSEETPLPKLSPNFVTNVCDSAREYSERGFSCFPLSLGERRPLAKWKRFQTEFPLVDEIDDWQDNGAPRTDGDTGEEIGREAVFNLAIVTGAISGIVVVDCDNEQAVQYAQDNGLTSPVTVRTRRGRHYYFRHPNNGRRYRNQIGTRPSSHWHNMPGLDFRGDGGFVVAPPSTSLNPDGTVKHQYQWVIAQGHDLDDMPVWTGPHDDMETTEGFDFLTLDLTNVAIGESAMDVREQVQKRVDFLGRKLQGPDCGDSTDEWMIRFCGQMVRRGVVGADLRDSVIQFHEEYFVWKKSRSELERWLKTKMRSAIEMDRRNHPQDYDATTKERIKEVESEPVISLQPVYSKDFQRLLDTLGDAVYHADPVVPSRSIIQVVGYNGHGKSFFVGNLVTAMAANQPQFGPFFINKPSKIFYLDFDNPARTVLNRFTGFAKVHGDPSSNLPIWSPAIIPPEAGGVMNLREQAGLETLQKWLDQLQPDVVVMDTVRNAFGGLDEKDPKDWFHVNRVAKIIRDRYKASVILVHHRNKPNEQGLGREAGSTAQLTDLDTQVIITQVYRDKHIAKTKAGIFNEDVSIERGGTQYHPFEYFETKLSLSTTMAGETRIRMITEVSFGKVREQTDLHQTYYLAYIENIKTGEQGLLWTPSPKEDAISMYNAGQTPETIAQELFIPTSEIKKWVGAK